MRIAPLLLALLVYGCGVKAPPIAPVREPAPAAQKLDCSPKDPDCDVVDPSYQPQGR